MKFSRKKFLNLPETRKIKKITDQMNLIFKIWHTSERKEEISNLLEMVSYWKVSNENMKIRDFLEKIDLKMGKRRFFEILTSIENHLGLSVSDSKITVKKNDNKSNSERKMPLTVVMDNLRSAFNVGSVIRTSECINVENLILCGCTATPEHKKVIETAMGTENEVTWEYFNDNRQALNELKSAGRKIYALETVKEAKSYNDVEYEFPMALWLGNEALGISEEILENVDEIIKIPVYGFKNSLNVGVAYAVGAYEIRKQFNKKVSGFL